MKRAAYIFALMVILPGFVHAQNFSKVKTGMFVPQKKRVDLLRDSSKNKELIVFKTNLRVNTDGSPTSYHPYDLSGTTKAINSIANAIVVTKKGSSKNLCLSKDTYSEAISVFEQFRDSHFEKTPDGYTITWENVLIPALENGIKKPCIYKTGPYKGYFASATSLKNGLKNKGECNCDDQVNPLTIPALVLAGGKNIVKEYGGGLGDLFIAYNPENKNIVYGVINDVGPADNLGEGSVFLNMKLKGMDATPHNKKETYKLSINHDVIIAIIPHSKNYKESKPYTANNITSRIKNWLTEAGYSSPETFISSLQAIQ